MVQLTSNASAQVCEPILFEGLALPIPSIVYHINKPIKFSDSSNSHTYCQSIKIDAMKDCNHKLVLFLKNKKGASE
jgi:hypothetical protein